MCLIAAEQGKAWQEPITEREQSKNNYRWGKIGGEELLFSEGMPVDKNEGEAGSMRYATRAPKTLAPVLVFAKAASVAGTALVRRIGEADTSLIHRRLLARTLRHIHRGGVNPIVVVPADAPDLADIAERAGAELMIQPHGKPGPVRAGVLHQRKSGAILLESDTPDIDAVLVRHAAQALGLFDLIVGPNWSGGAYLLGLRSPAHAFGLFDGVRWETGHMLEDLLARAPRHWVVGLLPVLAAASDRASLKQASEDHTPPLRRSSALGLITMTRR